MYGTYMELLTVSRNIQRKSTVPYHFIYIYITKSPATIATIT